MFKKLIIRAIDLILPLLEKKGPPEYNEQFAKFAASISPPSPLSAATSATSNVEGVSITLGLSAQKILEDSIESSWPPKNSMHRKIS